MKWVSQPMAGATLPFDKCDRMNENMFLVEIDYAAVTRFCSLQFSAV
jgi:hypothetical protein